MEQDGSDMISEVLDDLPQESIQEVVDSVNGNQVTDAIKRLTDDPTKIMDIMKDIQDRPEILAAVLSHIESNPNYKNQLTNMMQTNSKMKTSVNTMSMKEKRLLIKKMRKAKSLAGFKKDKFQTSRITSSRQLKEVLITPNFPEGTPYVDCDPHELDDGIYLYYGPNTGNVNKRVTRLCGFPVCGEVVIVRTDFDGTLSPYTNQEFTAKYGSR